MGVYAIHQSTDERYAMFQEYMNEYDGDETTELAFGADGTKIYAAFQDCGCEGSEAGLDLICGCLLDP